MKTRTAPHTLAAPAASPHYGADYFQWQSEIGRFGGWANLTKFSQFISPVTNVLDFGCGGGYLLANIDCHAKLGIEINPVARAEAKTQGIQAVSSPSNVDNDWADLIISNRALEHCAHPLSELQALLPKLFPGALAVF